VHAAPSAHSNYDLSTKPRSNPTPAASVPTWTDAHRPSI